MFTFIDVIKSIKFGDQMAHTLILNFLRTLHKFDRKLIIVFGFAYNTVS